MQTSLGQRVIPATEVPIIPGIAGGRQASSTSWRTTLPPRTSPSPSSLTSTMYPSRQSGPSLRRFLLGLRAAQPGPDLEVRERGAQVPHGAQVRRLHFLPLHLSPLQEVRQRCPPGLFLHGLPAPIQVIMKKRTPEEAFEPFKKIDILPFRDAAYGQCSYHCTVKSTRIRYWTV